MPTTRKVREGWVHPFEDKERNERMTDMRDEGWRTEDLAEYFGITQQRVYAVTNHVRRRRETGR